MARFARFQLFSFHSIQEFRMGYCVSYLHEPYHFAVMELPGSCRHVVICARRTECVTIGSSSKAGKSECHALHLVPFLVAHGTQALYGPLLDHWSIGR